MNRSEASSGGVAGALRLALLTAAAAWLAAWTLVVAGAVLERLGPAEIRSSPATDSPGIVVAAILFVLFPAALGSGWTMLALHARGRRHPFRLGALAGLVAVLALLGSLLAQRLWSGGYYVALLLGVVVLPLAALAIGPRAPDAPRSRLAHSLAAVALPLGLYGGFWTMAQLLG